MRFTRTPRRSAPALAIVAGTVAVLIAGPLGGVVAASPAVPVAAVGSACPTAVPMSEVKAGLTGTGLTVSQGSTPQPFAVTVLGVLPNGIGAGIDLIVFQGQSPALDAAGGIWAGMSGSPVYTKDGRLLGAVSYGFTAAPSKVGGITPAVSMMQLLKQPARSAAAAPRSNVALPEQLRGMLAAKGLAGAVPAGGGLSPLLVPLAVSGLTATRLARLNDGFERSGSPLRAYAGSSAPGSAAPAGSVFAGSNFAAALSYGDTTEAAIGTTTAVCGGKALVFGHPLLFQGPTSLSAHAATAIAVVRDDAMGSFKMATVGAIAGLVDQDRMAGLRAPLGPGPKGVVPIRSTVRSGTASRTATTWVTLDSWAATIVSEHLMANVDATFGQVGAGQATLGWTINGTRSGGAT